MVWKIKLKFKFGRNLDAVRHLGFDRK